MSTSVHSGFEMDNQYLSKYRKEFEQILGGMPTITRFAGKSPDLYHIMLTSSPHVCPHCNFVDREPVEIGHFSVSQLPGCCGILVFHDTFILEPYRGKGLGKLLLKIKLELACRQDFGLVLATVQETNSAEIHTLGRLGFVKTSVFANPKTGNDVVLFTRKLNPVLHGGNGITLFMGN